jgi:hypothetical protein
MAAILKPHVGGTAIQLRTGLVLRPHPHDDFVQFAALNRQLEIGEPPAAPAADARAAAVAAEVPHTLADLQRRLKAETDALDASIKQARSATSYPGISWPIVYGGGRGENNLVVFERVHAIPRPTPPIAESADRAAIAMEMIARARMEGGEGEAIVHEAAARALAQQGEGEVH